MKFSPTFMEPGLNCIPTTHVIKINGFLKRKGVHQPKSEFFIISTIIFMLSAETSLKGDFVFGSRFNFAEF
jgi:hypothetical protein